MGSDVNLSARFRTPLRRTSQLSARLNERDMQIRVGLHSILIARGVNGKRSQRCLDRTGRSL